jgi:hypothetical protein
MYSCSFHIFKLNNLKVIHDLHSQCLTEILSKTTWFMGMEGVGEERERREKEQFNVKKN